MYLVEWAATLDLPDFRGQAFLQLKLAVAFDFVHGLSQPLWARLSFREPGL